MSETEVLLPLIGAVYDAALDPALWPDTLRRAARFVGGSSASLYAKAMAGGNWQVYHHDDGLDERWLRRYAEIYVRIDPSTVRQFVSAVGDVLSTVDVMPYDEFRDTRFALEWAQPQHLVDCLNAVLDKTGTRVAMLAVFRDAEDGLVDAAARRRMAIIAPHFRRAMLVAETMTAKAGEVTAFADTIEAVGAGIFLLDRNGAVVHANAAARSMLASGLLFQRESQRLAMLDAGADRLFTAMLPCFAGSEGGGVTRTAFHIAGRDGVPHIAHVLPLGARGLACGVPAGAVLALFVRRAVFRGISGPELLAKAYRLTPGELRVLLAIADSGGAPEAAAALGVAVSTVKFHLRRLFDKTGTRRQADLVRLVAGFASPLTG